MLWKAEEWEANGYWHCNCTSDLAHGSATWYLPARILEISPAAFLELLIKEYKPDKFYYNKDSCFCCWSWKSQTQMRKYKNWLNKKARERNFQI